jgi:hypothetical protein
VAKHQGKVLEVLVKRLTVSEKSDGQAKNGAANGRMFALSARIRSCYEWSAKNGKAGGKV